METRNTEKKHGLELLLNPTDIAEILGFRRSKVNRMLATGEIPSLIVSQGERRRAFRVKPSELSRWLKSREVKQTND